MNIYQFDLVNMALNEWLNNNTSSLTFISFAVNLALICHI